MFIQHLLSFMYKHNTQNVESPIYSCYCPLCSDSGRRRSSQEWKMSVARVEDKSLSFKVLTVIQTDFFLP